MIPASFEYARAGSVEEAIQLLGSNEDAKVIAVRHNPGFYDHYWIRYEYFDSAGQRHENTHQFSISKETGQEERPSRATGPSAAIRSGEGSRTASRSDPLSNE